MRFRLRYLKHDLELFAGTFVIGRSAECQLSLDDPLVSRRHALLLVGDDEVLIEDAGSRNGVLVNGQRIPGRTRLGEGDRVTIGAQDMSIAAVSEGDAPKRAWGQTGAQPHGPITIMSLPAASRSEMPAPPATPIDEPTYDRPRRG